MKYKPKENKARTVNAQRKTAPHSLRVERCAQSSRMRLDCTDLFVAYLPVSPEKGREIEAVFAGHGEDLRHLIDGNMPLPPGKIFVAFFKGEYDRF